jgi:hypothetical protein
MNDEGLADAGAASPFVYPDFTQELIQRGLEPVLSVELEASRYL